MWRFKKMMGILTLLPAAAGQFCHLPYWLTASFTVLSMTPSQSEPFPNWYLCNVGICKQLFDTL
jgi:hypothetical protein